MGERYMDKVILKLFLFFFLFFLCVRWLGSFCLNFFCLFSFVLKLGCFLDRLCVL